MSILTRETIKKLLLGKTIEDRYDIYPDGFLGEGGFGFVFKGRHQRLGVKIKDVAIKIIKQKMWNDPKKERELFNEAILQMKLEAEIQDVEARELITKVYDFGVTEVEDTGEHKGAKKRIGYIVMELVKGSDLDKECGLFEERKMVETIATKYIEQVCKGLKPLHRLSTPIIHRDIKPENIMLMEDKKVKITDFGLANRLNHAYGWAKGTAGTQVYMAPETLIGSGLSIAASDVFSIGVSWYQMITGKYPFDDELPPNGREDAEAKEWRYKRRQEVRPLSPRHFNSTCREEISDIILKCLQFDAKDRYKDAGELLDAIKPPKKEDKEDSACRQLFNKAMNALHKQEYLLLSKLGEKYLQQCAPETGALKNGEMLVVARSVGIALTHLGQYKEAGETFFRLRKDVDAKKYGIVTNQEKVFLYEAEISLHQLTKNTSKERIVRKKLDATLKSN
ncbi:MAG: serine/threonine protein kinase [Lewinellaceae bacterium]|nr:serine/threonine protein kinase [Lewinellaceae bacterium]